MLCSKAWLSTVVNVFPKEVKEATSAPFPFRPHGLAGIEMVTEAFHEDVLEEIGLILFFGRARGASGHCWPFSQALMAALYVIKSGKLFCSCISPSC